MRHHSSVVAVVGQKMVLPPCPARKRKRWRGFWRRPARALAEADEGSLRRPKRTVAAAGCDWATGTCRARVPMFGEEGQRGFFFLQEKNEG
jgi:hypothetical protein